MTDDDTPKIPVMPPMPDDLKQSHIRCPECDGRDIHLPNEPITGDPNQILYEVSYCRDCGHEQDAWPCTPEFNEWRRMDDVYEAPAYGEGS